MVCVGTDVCTTSKTKQTYIVATRAMVMKLPGSQDPRTHIYPFIADILINFFLRSNPCA